MSALFRLADTCGGAITIDGRDISTLGLNVLRRQLAVVPQTPVMFTGTLRDNCDPFHEQEDAEVW